MSLFNLNPLRISLEFGSHGKYKDMIAAKAETNLHMIAY